MNRTCSDKKGVAFAILVTVALWVLARATWGEATVHARPPNQTIPTPTPSGQPVTPPPPKPTRTEPPPQPTTPLPGGQISPLGNNRINDILNIIFKVAPVAPFEIMTINKFPQNSSIIGLLTESSHSQVVY